MFCITRASTHLTVQNVAGVRGRQRERDLDRGGQQIQLHGGRMQAWKKNGLWRENDKGVAIQTRRGTGMEGMIRLK